MENGVNKMRTNEKYSTLKLVLLIATLTMSIWALVIAYQAKQTADWVDAKQNNIIEWVLFSN